MTETKKAEQGLDIREILLNTYLKISSQGSDLRDIAYAKLVSWLLFYSGVPMSEREIGEQITKELSIHSIPEDSLSKAIQHLKQGKQIILQDDKWTLEPSNRLAMEKQLAYSQGVTTKILKKFFPQSIPNNVLRAWFAEANEKYFGSKAKHLVELYTKKQAPIENVLDVLKPVIDKYKLAEYREQLVQGYKEFLSSEDREDQERLWQYMQSLLATRLISADVSPEYFNIAHFKNVNFLVDTNVLFALTLEHNEAMSRALNILGKIVKKLNIKLHVSRFTFDEYERVRAKEKEESLKVWGNVNPNIISRMSTSGDDFARVMVKRGCQTVEDVERFFDEDIKFPTRIDGVELIQLPENSYGNVDYNQKRDEKAYNEVSDAFKDLTGRPKPENATIHDVLTRKLIQHLNQKEKFFALTLDRSMEMLALKYVNDKEEPDWINLRSLIQILALNGGGPEFDSEDLSPLIGIFFGYEEIGKNNSFDKRDLLLLTDVPERLNELPDTKVVALLNLVHRSRMNGAGETALKEVRLEVERALRSDSAQAAQALHEQREKIKELESENARTAHNFNKSEASKNILRFLLRSVVALVISAFVIVYLGGELKKAIHLDHRYDVYQIALFILAPLIYIARDLIKTRAKNKQLLGK